MRRSTEILNLERGAKSFLISTSEEEAWNRDRFIDHISSVLIGALGEFYKSRIGAKNSQVHYVKKWMNEAERIGITEFDRNLRRATKGMSDYDKAYSEIRQEIKDTEQNERRLATNKAEETYKQEMAVPLDDEDFAAFIQMIDGAYNAAKARGFASSGPQEKKPARRGNSFAQKKK